MTSGNRDAADQGLRPGRTRNPTHSIPRFAVRILAVSPASVPPRRLPRAQPKRQQPPGRNRHVAKALLAEQRNPASREVPYAATQARSWVGSSGEGAREPPNAATYRVEVPRGTSALWASTNRDEQGTAQAYSPSNLRPTVARKTEHPRCVPLRDCSANRRWESRNIPRHVVMTWRGYLATWGLVSCDDPAGTLECPEQSVAFALPNEIGSESQEPHVPSLRSRTHIPIAERSPS